PHPHPAHPFCDWRGGIGIPAMQAHSCQGSHFCRDRKKFETAVSTKTNRREAQMTSRISFSEVKQATKGQWQNILPLCGINSSYLTSKHGPCPVCNGKDRFRFDNKDGNGTFFCNNCGAGDGFKLLGLHLNKSIKETFEIVATHLGDQNFNNKQPVYVSPKISTMQAKEKLQKTWDSAIPISPGDPAHQYLTQTRRILLDRIPKSLRFHRKLSYYEGSAYINSFPAMLAVVADLSNKPITIHRTYLTDDGKKAPVSNPKKLMSSVENSINGAGIRLYKPTTILGISEGIETALACHVATKYPVWSAISANGMANLEIPDSVIDIIIFADNDKKGAGQTHAKKLEDRMLTAGKRVKLLIPPEEGSDWLDFLIKQGELNG
ncbi:MAG: toprim domain-containing protein, partial [Candidatus Obscuribacterales bacterium]|nr:toprim domain-containing protein [Candidatus Obscuribacterales bacterium]